MMTRTVTYGTYCYDMQTFATNHHGNCTVSESKPTQDGSYRREYIYEDGAVFSELLEFVWRDAAVILDGVTYKSEHIRFFRTTYYSSDNQTRKCVYEVSNELVL